MGTRESSAPDLLPGTLEMIILETLGANGAMHGFGIARHLKTRSREVIQVGEGSLYPALQRLLVNGLVKAEWKMSEQNRRARYYSITAAGKKRLAADIAEFDQMVDAIRRILRPA